jgi:hypothetical protein
MAEKQFKTPNGNILTEGELKKEYGERFNSLIQDNTFTEVTEGGEGEVKKKESSTPSTTTGTQSVSQEPKTKGKPLSVGEKPKKTGASASSTGTTKTVKTFGDTKVLYINRDSKRGPVDEIPKPEDLPEGYTYKIVQNSNQLEKWKKQKKENVSTDNLFGERPSTFTEQKVEEKRVADKKSDELVSKFGIKPGEKVSGVEKKAYEAQKNKPKVGTTKTQPVVSTKPVSEDLTKKIGEKYDVLSQIPAVTEKIEKQIKLTPDELLIISKQQDLAINQNYNPAISEEKLKDELDEYQLLDGISEGIRSSTNKFLLQPLTDINKYFRGDKDFTIKKGVPLAIEKEQAEKELIEEKGLGNFTKEDVSEKAKSIFLKNDELSQKKNATDTYFSNLPEGHQVQRELDIKLKADYFKSNEDIRKTIQLKQVNDDRIDAYNKFLIEINNKGTATEEDKAKGQELFYLAKKAEEENVLLRKSYKEDLSKLEKDEDKLELLKYNYNDLDKTRDILNNFFKETIGGGLKLIGETRELAFEETIGRLTGLDYQDPLTAAGNYVMDIGKESKKGRPEFRMMTLDDVNNWSDAGSWLGQVATEQTGVAAALAIGGPVGLEIISAGSGGAKIKQMEESTKDYSKLQKVLSGWAYYGAEKYTEKYSTFKYIEDLKGSLNTISTEARSLAEKSFKKEIGKVFAGTLAQTQIGAGSEALSSLSNSISDIFINGDKLSSSDIAKNMKEAYAAGLVMDGGVSSFGALSTFTSRELRAISDNKDIKEVRDVINKVEEINKELNTNLLLTDKDKAILQEKSDMLSGKAVKIIAKSVDNVGRLSENEITKLLDINKQQSELKAEFDDLRKSAMSSELKKEEYESLNKKFVELEKERNSIVDGTYSEFDYLPEEQQIKLKTEAAETIIQEQIDKGIERDKIQEPNPEVINKKAKEIYETRKTTNEEKLGGDTKTTTKAVSAQGENAAKSQEKIDALRVEEVKELTDNVENPESFITDGKIDAKKVSESDNAKAKEIYAKYDKLIKPLLTNIKTQEDAIQKQITNEGVLQPGQSEMGLQEVEQGNTEQEITSKQGEEKIIPGKKSNVSGVEITYPTEEEAKNRRDERSKPEYIESSAKDLVEEDVDSLKKDLEGDFGILTAENPMAQPLTEEENSSLNKKAEEWLKKKGYSPRRVVGKYGQAENSFFVPNLTKQDAVAFAKEFNQESVAHSEGLVYQDGSVNPRVKSSDNFELSEDYNEDSDYVSVVKTKDGLKTFSVGYNFGRKIGGGTDTVTISTSDSNFDDKVNESSNKRIAKIAVKAARSLSKILPDLNIVLHNTNDSFVKVSGESKNQSSSGLYQDGTIHINLEKANRRTVAHEVFHAILLDRVKTDANAQAVTKKMIQAIASKIEGNPALKAKLEDFASMYDENIQNEEKLAEFIGILAANYDSLSGRAKEAIKAWLNSLARMFGVEMFESNEVLDVLNTIAKKVATGKEISKEDVLSIGEENVDVSDLTSRFQANFKDPVSGVEFVYDKNTGKFKELEKDGFITKDKSVSDFNGKILFLHQPDAAFSGMIYKNGELLVEGKGGMYYPIKFHEDGYFWASTSTTAKKMAEDLNKVYKANGGQILMALTTAPSDKLLSSTTAANGVMDLILSKAFDRGFSVNKEQIKKSLVNAANKLVVKKSLVKDKKTGEPILDKKGNKQYKEKIVGLNLKLKKGNSLDDVKSEIKNKLNPENSSFDDRKTFVEGFLSEIANVINLNPKAVDQFGNFFSKGINNKVFKGVTKTGKLSISAANLKQAVSEMLTEPMLKEGVERNKGGQVYAIIELNGDVKPVDSDKHESYPKAIQSVDPKNNKVKLHILTDRVKWSDVFEDPSTNDIVSKDRELSIFPTSGVSTTGLRLNTKNLDRQQKPQGETDYQRIAKVKLDKKELNTVRASLRNTLPNSLTLEVLDAVAKGETLGYDSDMDAAIEDMIENGISINNIANILMQDEEFLDKKNITSKKRAIDYLVLIGNKATLFKAAYRKQKVLPQTVSSKLTENKDGDFVFKHYSDQERDVIKRGQGNNAITSREEASALSAVGGLAMFYTMEGQKETGVGNVEHTVTIPKDKVYDIDSDPLGFEKEARKRFNDVRPGQAFTNNHRGAFITKIANENGFDMAVTQWRGSELRAQTTNELKPSNDTTPFKERPLPTFEVGDKAIIDGKESIIESVEGQKIGYKSIDGTAQGVTINNERNRRSIIKIEPEVSSRKQKTEEEVTRKKSVAAKKNVLAGKAGRLDDSGKANPLESRMLNITLINASVLKNAVSKDLYDRFVQIIQDLSTRRLTIKDLTNDFISNVNETYDSIISDYNAELQKIDDIQSKIDSDSTLTDSEQSYIDSNKKLFKAKVDEDASEEKKEKRRVKDEENRVKISNAVKAVSDYFESSDIKPSSMEFRILNALSSLTQEDIDNMDSSMLDNAVNALESASDGVMTSYAENLFVYKTGRNAYNAAKKSAESKKGGVYGSKVSGFIPEMRQRIKAFIAGNGKDTIKDRVESIALFAIDSALKRYSGNVLYENITSLLSKRVASHDEKMRKVNTNLKQVYDNILKDSKNVHISLMKIRYNQLQNMFNLNKEKNNTSGIYTARQFFDETLVGSNSKYGEDQKKLIKEFLKALDNNEFDVEDKGMNKGMIKMDKIEGAAYEAMNRELQDKSIDVYESSFFQNGNAAPLVEGYASVQPNTDSSQDDDFQAITSNFSTPSTKSGNLISKKGSLHPINLNPFSATISSINSTDIQFELRSEINGILKGLNTYMNELKQELKNKNLSDKETKIIERKAKETKEIYEAVKNASELLVSGNTLQSSGLDTLLDKASNIAYKIYLASGIRTAADFAGNVMAAAIQDPTASIKGLKVANEISKLKGDIDDNMSTFLVNIQNPQITRVMETKRPSSVNEEFANRGVNTNFATKNLPSKLESFINKVKIKSGFGKVTETTRSINEKLTSISDNLPYYHFSIGKFVNEFNKISNKELDVEAVINDPNYLIKNRDLITKAANKANYDVSELMGSKNTFENPIRVTRAKVGNVKGRSGLARAITVSSNFLNTFSDRSIDAVSRSINKALSGEETWENVKKVVSQSVRATSYALMINSIMGVIASALMGEDDEEEKLKDSLDNLADNDKFIKSANDFFENKETTYKEKLAFVDEMLKDKDFRMIHDILKSYNNRIALGGHVSALAKSIEDKYDKEAYESYLKRVDDKFESQSSAALVYINSLAYLHSKYGMSLYSDKEREDLIGKIEDKLEDMNFYMMDFTGPANALYAVDSDKVLDRSQRRGGPLDITLAERTLGLMNSYRKDDIVDQMKTQGAKWLMQVAIGRANTFIKGGVGVGVEYINKKSVDKKFGKGYYDTYVDNLGTPSKLLSDKSLFGYVQQTISTSLSPTASTVADLIVKSGSNREWQVVSQILSIPGITDLSKIQSKMDKNKIKEATGRQFQENMILDFSKNKFYKTKEEKEADEKAKMTYNSRLYQEKIDGKTRAVRKPKSELKFGGK